MAAAAAAISRSGEVIPWASTCTSPRARAPATRALTTGEAPAPVETETTSTVTATAATITAPSFILMEDSGSSGRTSLRRLEGVPHPVDRPDDAGAELAPQRPHVGVDRPGPGAAPVPP